MRARVMAGFWLLIGVNVASLIAVTVVFFTRRTSGIRIATLVLGTLVPPLSIVVVANTLLATS